MLTRKRARDELLPSQSATPTSYWHSLLPELLLAATSYLFRDHWYYEYLAEDVQLLLRLSSVCVEWRAHVNNHSSVSHIDF